MKEKQNLKRMNKREEKTDVDQVIKYKTKPMKEKQTVKNKGNRKRIQN